jgi:hypothetical protein
MLLYVQATSPGHFFISKECSATAHLCACRCGHTVLLAHAKAVQLYCHLFISKNALLLHVCLHAGVATLCCWRMRRQCSCTGSSTSSRRRAASAWSSQHTGGCPLTLAAKQVRQGQQIAM